MLEIEYRYRRVVKTTRQNELDQFVKTQALALGYKRIKMTQINLTRIHEMKVKKTQATS